MRIKIHLVIVCIAGMMITSKSCRPLCGCVDPPMPMLKTGDVLVAGSILQTGASGTNTAVYWRNGRIIPLILVSKRPITIHGIAASGNDVYVVGDTSNMLMEPTPVYWKNGQLIALAERGSANSIFISGTDIYIAGTVNSHGIATAVYWKNGIMHTLAGDPAKYSLASSVFVSGTDVYVSGVTENTTSHVAKATYWKNNVPVLLPGTTNASGANTIYVKGSDIYVGGYTLEPGSGISVATLWKNGIALFLSTINSGVNSITVSGNDIYAVGSATSTAYSGKTFWKNGELTPLPGTITGGTVLGGNCITAFGSDLYIGGTSTSGAALWKNGVETKLYTPNGQVNAICIVP